MSNFRAIDRQTGFLLPPSVDEWLPERHLARFVVEVIDGLDLRAMVGAYRGAGSAAPAALTREIEMPTTSPGERRGPRTPAQQACVPRWRKVRDLHSQGVDPEV